ncbi:MAG: Succinyl-CoA:3-ketoacid-coenzyme A transferase subunit A, partial [uncultured Acetobacteraceae bacterium]
AEEQAVRGLRRSRGRHPGRFHDRLRRLRRAGHALQPHPRAAGPGRAQPHLRVQHHRRGAPAPDARHRDAGGERAGAEGGLLLHRRHASDRRAALRPIPRSGPGGGGAGAAGHARRTPARRRQRHPRLLHAHRRRHGDRGRPRNAELQRPRAPAGARVAGGLRPSPRLSGRRSRKPPLPAGAAELQPGHGHGGAHRPRRGGGGAAPRRRHGPGRGPHTRHFRPPLGPHPTAAGWALARAPIGARAV